VNLTLRITVGTVLLHLYAGALARRQSSTTHSSKLIHSIYIAVPSPFPVLEDFIASSARDYSLDLFTCRPSSDTVESVQTPSTKNTIEYVEDLAPKAESTGKAKGGEGMRQALAMYKEHFPEITGILIGTRRTDPHGGTLSYREMQTTY